MSTISGGGVRRILGSRPAHTKSERPYLQKTRQKQKEREGAEEAAQVIQHLHKALGSFFSATKTKGKMEGGQSSQR
jgi:hypothetical protein